jgi:hypothetical protein
MHQQVIKLCDTNKLKWKKQHHSKLSSSTIVSQEHSTNTFIRVVSGRVHSLNQFYMKFIMQIYMMGD